MALHTNKEKTAFSTNQGLWQLTVIPVIPFRLCNAPATFKQLMESILQDFTYKACLVYLDDVTVVGQTFQEQPDNLQVFQRFQGACLKHNPEMCQLIQEVVQYLGHVSLKGVTTDPEKLKAVQRWPPLRDKHKLRTVLGSYIYYRTLTAGFPDIAKPMTQLMEEKRSFQWFPQAEAPFQSLKVSLCIAPILGYLWPAEHIIDTDANNMGTG
jgi:hypothetical protein